MLLKTPDKDKTSTIPPDKRTTGEKLAALSKRHSAGTHVRPRPRGDQQSEDDDGEPPRAADKFLSRAQVMDATGLSYPTIWQWMREGKFPRSREVGGRLVFWRKSEIDAWMASMPVRPLKGEPGAQGVQGRSPDAHQGRPPKARR
jgi:prophage regulatory protein